ncbi:hypothetical protein FH972_025441 [Carpinus fangiana]|uniref:SAC domain-containing protein n=1 Tax=Carpinus fangiana TaxID=176857 RepID=A0A5N6L117_9ROSI|nr:hypothetical protein FH972_025441 [Carpinus fangiana]
MTWLCDGLDMLFRAIGHGDCLESLAGAMPGLVRKLIVLAAVDGLILQPLAPWNTRGAPSVHIAYGTHAVTRLSLSEAAQATAVENDDGDTGGLEVHAVVGLLKIASFAYLIAVSRREQVAQLWNKPVYAITDVSLIPLSSRHDAESAITRATRSIAGDDLGDDDDSDPEHIAHLDEDWLDDLVLHGNKNPPSSRSRRGSLKEPSVAEDVMRNKGAYGRFSGGWFSRTGWTSGQRKNMGLSSQEDLLKPADVVVGASPFSSPSLTPAKSQDPPDTTPLDPSAISEHLKSSGNSAAVEDRITALVPKLVQTTKLLFGSKTFFYAYDHDITRRLPELDLQPTDTPLYRRVDPQYFWNNNLSRLFVDAGLDEYVLPVMQGFIGQRAFTIASTQSKSKAQPNSVETEGIDTTEVSAFQNSFLVSLVSRRSIRRSGLRYLRRGIDEEGNVANSVETEQLLSRPSWDSASPVQSFVQVRGSIPLFFTQTPYNLKPVPKLHGSPEANARATKLHFQTLSGRYGFLHAISLVNGHGNEAEIGTAYQAAVDHLNANGGIDSKPIGFEWFDFHTVCKGMKFENVSQLLDSTASFLDSCAWSTVKSSNLQQLQKGVMRVNCMDCLDRTNVVQSSFAERILSHQLSAVLHTSIDLRSDPSTTWLATLWADNGDAVSLAYTSTAALKGDYVRTRRRNVFGLLTDLSLTLSRYYHNLFEDFFVQSALDYLLGNVNARVFADFEAGVRGADLSVDVNRVRREAVDACARKLIQGEDGTEELLGGWAMAAPADDISMADSKPTGSFGAVHPNKVMYETIFLLTDRCVARVSYDWEAEHVGDVHRVPLEKIKSLQWGTWICDTLSPSQMDETRNVGFIVAFEKPEHELGTIRDGAKPDHAIVGTVAFKALSTRSAVVRPEQQDTMKLGERDLVRHVCEEIARAIGELKQEHNVDVVEKDIVSLEQARKSTGYIDQLGHSLKKMVWG